MFDLTLHQKAINTMGREGAWLRVTDEVIKNEVFVGKNFSQSSWSNAILIGCKFINCELSELGLKNCRFEKCRFEKCEMQFWRMRETLFAECVFPDTRVLHLTGVNSMMRDCDFSFSDTNILEISMLSVNCNFD